MLCHWPGDSETEYSLSVIVYSHSASLQIPFLNMVNKIQLILHFITTRELQYIFTLHTPFILRLIVMQPCHFQSAVLFCVHKVKLYTSAHMQTKTTNVCARLQCKLVNMCLTHCACVLILLSGGREIEYTCTQFSSSDLLNILYHHLLVEVLHEGLP